MESFENRVDNYGYRTCTEKYESEEVRKLKSKLYQTIADATNVFEEQNRLIGSQEGIVQSLVDRQQDAEQRLSRWTQKMNKIIKNVINW